MTVPTDQHGRRPGRVEIRARIPCGASAGRRSRDRMGFRRVGKSPLDDRSLDDGHVLRREGLRGVHGVAPAGVRLDCDRRDPGDDHQRAGHPGMDLTKVVVCSGGQAARIEFVHGARCEELSRSHVRQGSRGSKQRTRIVHEAAVRQRIGRRDRVDGADEMPRDRVPGRDSNRPGRIAVESHHATWRERRPRGDPANIHVVRRGGKTP